MNTDEERIAAALRPFGWTCTKEFWERYYTDPWVFNLVNAVDKLTGKPMDKPEPPVRVVHEPRKRHWWEGMTPGGIDP